MRHFIILIILLTSTMMSAQVFPVETIKYSGDKDSRINLVILSEGYVSSELDQFIIDANNFVNKMFLLSPFKEYEDYFNVYAIKTPSNESGADHPLTATSDPFEPGGTMTFVDTYFNATYDAYGTHRILFYEIDGNYANNTELKINTLLASNVPEFDQAIIIVNSNEYGGSGGGGDFPMAYNGYWGADVTIHEIGHSLFNLHDEYYAGDAAAFETTNMTQESDPNAVRWKNWLDEDGIGIYQHKDFEGNLKNWYRPNQTCIMRDVFSNNPFCLVCQEGIIEKIHDLISPIDSYQPNNTVNNPTLPMDFQLDLIKTTPNTLESEWTLNAVPFASNVDQITLTETDLIEGTNILTSIIHDATTSLRVDNHDSFHVNMVTWTINYTVLGINEIESDTNNFNISLYPNPTNTIVNLKFESNTVQNLKVDIVSFDGKKVKTVFISNYENQDVNISNLSQGIYMTNFYSNTALIASKKLVKN